MMNRTTMTMTLALGLFILVTACSSSHSGDTDLGDGTPTSQTGDGGSGDVEPSSGAADAGARDGSGTTSASDSSTTDRSDSSTPPPDATVGVQLGPYSACSEPTGSPRITITKTDSTVSICVKLTVALGTCPLAQGAWSVTGQGDWCLDQVLVTDDPTCQSNANAVIASGATGSFSVGNDGADFVQMDIALTFPKDAAWVSEQTDIELDRCLLDCSNQDCS